MSDNNSPLTLVAVTPADTNLPGITRAVWVEGTGTLVVTDNAGNTTTLTAPALGVWHPMNVVRIALASTATGIRIQY